METPNEHPSPTPLDPATPPSAPRDPGSDPQPVLASPDAESAPADAVIAPDVPRMGVPIGATLRARDPSAPHPSYVFLAVVSVITLVADVSTKVWAEKRLDQYPPFINVWENHLSFILAKNKGGAWGLLQGTNESVRRPFFLLVSAAAIAFIVTLYRRLQPRQRALKWGLPLVLGGALGNVFDRIRYGHVIDFIDYRADWVKAMNELVTRLSHGGGSATDHWPTFNIADVAICVGVGLMAIDMFTTKRGRVHPITGQILAPSMPPPPMPAASLGASGPDVTQGAGSPDVAPVAPDATHESKPVE